MSWVLRVRRSQTALHGVKKSQVIAHNARTHEGSEELCAYAKSLIEKNVEQGKLLDE